MAIKKISEFVSAVPSSDSKILFEQNEKGKSCTVGDAVNTCALSYDEIMATNPEPDLSGKVASASALKHLKPITGHLELLHVSYGSTLAYLEGANVTIPAKCIFGISANITWNTGMPVLIMLADVSSGSNPPNLASTSNAVGNGAIGCSYVSYTSSETTFYVWGKSEGNSTNTNVNIKYWYIQL